MKNSKNLLKITALSLFVLLYTSCASTKYYPNKVGWIIDNEFLVRDIKTDARRVAMLNPDSINMLDSLKYTRRGDTVLVQHPDYSDYKYKHHIWCLSDPAPKIIFINRDSIEARKQRAIIQEQMNTNSR